MDAAASAGASPPPPRPVSPIPQAAVLDENVVAALCYFAFVLTGILFLVIEPYNRNPAIRFHAYQSIFFWLAVVIGGIALSAISFIILALPFIGGAVSFLLSLAYWLGAVVLWLYLMYKAYNRVRVVLPVIGPWAEKQAQSV
jgi:uncharacterized membrane protein